MNWTHYDPYGYWISSVYGDSDFGNVRSIGVGHHFDHLLVDDWSAYVSIDNTEFDGWKPGFFLEKVFDQNYRARFSLQPFTMDKTLSLSGYFFDRSLYAYASYNFDRDEVGLAGSYRVTENTSVFANVYREPNGAVTAAAGLTVYFVTGDPSARFIKRREEKPIEWLSAPAREPSSSPAVRVVRVIPNPEPIQEIKLPEIPRAVEQPIPPRAPEWVLQVGAFGDASNADRFAQRLRGMGLSATVDRSTLNLVNVEGYQTQDEARAAGLALKTEKIIDGFIVKRALP